MDELSEERIEEIKEWLFSRGVTMVFHPEAADYIAELLEDRKQLQRRIEELKATQTSLGRSALNLAEVIERLVNWRDCYDAMLRGEARFSREESIELDSRWAKARATLRSESQP